ncbi:HNH endonuclease signature motif containing protein, partial [Demequina sp.]|uniref:HNH endonuclease n=1 Tax=Demequina sp. TaxID=2050685 RepID=UPI0025FF102A
SSGDLGRDAEAVRAFEGRSGAELDNRELLAFVKAAAAVKRRSEMLLAVGAAELRLRSQKQHGAGGMARRHGQPSARRLVADTLGGSEAEAERLIVVGTMLENASQAEAGGDEGPEGADGPTVADRPAAWPLVAAAVREGLLGPDKAAVITDALDVIGERGTQGLEAELVAKAKMLPLRHLKRAVDSAIALLDRAALRDKQEAQHEARALRVWEDRAGMTQVRGELDPVTAAPVRAFLEAYVREALAAKRDADVPPGLTDHRTTNQMNADGLSTMASHVLGCGSPIVKPTTTVIVRIDKQELEAELGVGTCDQLQAPLSGFALRTMATNARIIPALMDGRSLPLDLGSAKDFFTAAQRLALLERDGGCAICHAPPSWCEAHHVRWRSRGGTSDLSNGLMLCTACHHRLHRDGWDVEIRGDRVWIIPPEHIDPSRTPVLGGRAALEIQNAPPEPLPTG